MGAPLAIDQFHEVFANKKYLRQGTLKVFTNYICKKIMKNDHLKNELSLTILPVFTSIFSKLYLLNSDVISS